MSSMSSTQSGSMAFNRIIKDFKKALGERKTPRNLVYLKRIMILILFITIALSAVDFSLHQNLISDFSGEN
jgi:Na+/proline symporter